MKTFSVKNFEKFQHYKDRAPPWIKLYNELLDDYQFACLQDASKMHLIAIWLLASRSENKIPYDPEWISKRINATDPVDLDALARAGFIVVNQELQSSEQDASNMLAKCLPRDRGETETEERQSRADARDEDAKRLGDFCQAIVSAYSAAGSPTPPNTARASLWLAQGYDPEICLAVIAQIVPKRPNVGLSYFDKPIQEAHASKAPPRKPLNHDPPKEDWDAAAKMWITLKRWPRGHGNDPDSPSCRAPIDVLRKHGITSSQTVAA